MWKREQILAQLLTVLEAVPGAAYVTRDRGALQSDKRPAIQLLDSDEVADRTMFDRGRAAEAPNYIWMTPGVYVTMENKLPENIGIGTDLNVFCGAVIKAVAASAELKALVARQDGIRYDGLATDLDEDRTCTGKARIGLSFLYYLSPDEL